MAFFFLTGICCCDRTISSKKRLCWADVKAASMQQPKLGARPAAPPRSVAEAQNEAASRAAPTATARGEDRRALPPSRRRLSCGFVLFCFPFSRHLTPSSTHLLPPVRGAEEVAVPPPQGLAQLPLLPHPHLQRHPPLPPAPPLPAGRSGPPPARTCVSCPKPCGQAPSWKGSRG